MPRLLLLSFILCLFSSIKINAQNQPPQISNLTADVNLSNNTVTLSFDLEDAENDDVEITLRVSDNDGQTFVVNTTIASGEVGFPITPGTGKQIVWTPDNFDFDYKIQLVADDLQPVDIQEMVDQVDSVWMWEVLGFLGSGPRHRGTGEELLDDTRGLFEETFLDQNLELVIQNVPFSNYMGQNIIGRHTGVKDESKVFIIDGHYDSVSNSPGADDNATAIVGVLEAARILSNYQFEHTIKFIGFDLEEEGFEGSLEFVSFGIADFETIGGVVNLEMIGYYDETANSQMFPPGFGSFFPDAFALLEADSFRGNFITNVGYTPVDWLRDSFFNIANIYVPELNIINLTATTDFSLPQNQALLRSDHTSFWLTGKPAIMLTDGADFRNPYYHTAQDTRDKLDQNFMTNVVKASIATIARLAKPRHSTSANVDILAGTQTLNCDFKIFPNPVADFISMKLGECLTKDLQIEIYDTTGKLLFVKKGNPKEDNFDQLDLNFLKPGLYFLKILNEEGFLSKKIMVF